MQRFISRMRRILGMHDMMLVAVFLAANTFVEVALDIFESTTARVLWFCALAGVAVGFAFREAHRTGRRDALDGSNYGVSAHSRLAERRGAVIVLGLDSNRSDSATAKLLREATNLEYLVLVGTHETRQQGVAERVLRYLAAACGHELSDKHVRVLDHNNSLSVGDNAQAVSEAIAWLEQQGLAPREIIVDISTGRRMAGFGALQAADARRVETQYLAYKWDHVAHKPVRSEPAFRIVSDYWSTTPRWRRNNGATHDTDTDGELTPA